MPNWENFVKYFEEYTNGFSKLGIAFLVADIILVLALIVFVFKVLKLKLKVKKVFLFVTVILLVYGIDNTRGTPKLESLSGDWICESVVVDQTW